MEREVGDSGGEQISGDGEREVGDVGGGQISGEGVDGGGRQIGEVAGGACVGKLKKKKKKKRKPQSPASLRSEIAASLSTGRKNLEARKGGISGPNPRLDKVLTGGQGTSLSHHKQLIAHVPSNLFTPLTSIPENKARVVEGLRAIEVQVKTFDQIAKYQIHVSAIFSNRALLTQNIH